MCWSISVTSPNCRARCANFIACWRPGARASVPDLDTLCALFTDPALSFAERVHLMRMLFGGQSNAADFHKAGLNEEFLRDFLLGAGFIDIVRSEEFGLFDDSSALVFRGRRISLNLSARKPVRD